MGKRLKPEILDITDPNDARKWLTQIEVNGLRINAIVTEGDHEVSIEDASDEEILRVADNIARMLASDNEPS